MGAELKPISTQPLLDYCRGSDPATTLKNLETATGANCFVRVPEGYRGVLEIKAFAAAHERRCKRGEVRIARDPSFLQMSREQIRDLFIYRTIFMDKFEFGGLYQRLNDDGSPSSDLDRIFLGPTALVLKEPIDRRRETNHAMGGTCTVVMLNRRKDPIQFGLQGVTFADIYVGERLQDSKVPEDPLPQDGHQSEVGTPLDPFQLEKSSPLVYAIYKAAHHQWQNNLSATKRSLAEDLAREHNHNFNTNPKPFADKRGDFAGTCARPKYKYNCPKPKRNHGKSGKPGAPGEEFLFHPSVNPRLRDVLYAAACWNDQLKPQLGKDPTKLVKHLWDLEFWDRRPDDQVNWLVFLITGEPFRRDERRLRYKDEE